MISCVDKAVLRRIPDIWVLPRHSTKEKGDLKQQPAPPSPDPVREHTGEQLTPMKTFLLARVFLPFPPPLSTHSLSEHIDVCH